MKFTQATLMAVAGSLPAAKADFYLFATRVGGNWLSPGNDFAVFDSSEPSCDSVGDAVIWRTQGDVSGGKWGVRCDGSKEACNTGENVEEGLDVVEMNFNADEFHWTWYKDRDGALYNLDGDKIGSCDVAQMDERKFCNLGIGGAYFISLLQCKTSYTAEEIDDNQPS